MTSPRRPVFSEVGDRVKSPFSMHFKVYLGSGQNSTKHGREHMNMLNVYFPLWAKI